MAGRGRGGGGRGISFRIENLGIYRLSDLAGTQAVQPPALFPPLPGKLSPPEETEELKYLVAVKQNLRTARKEAIGKNEFRVDSNKVPSFLEPNRSKKRPASKTTLSSSSFRRSVASKRVKLADGPAAVAAVNEELSTAVDRDLGGKTIKTGTENAIEDTLNRLESSVGGLANTSDEGESEADEGVAGDVDEVEADADGEDETDYNQNYFDNGENYLDDDTAADEDGDDDGGAYY